MNIIKKIATAIRGKPELPKPCTECAGKALASEASKAASVVLAQSLKAAHDELSQLKKVFRNLTCNKPILVVLPSDANLIATDYQVVDGRFVRIDKSLIGRPAGLFSIFVRKVI